MANALRCLNLSQVNAQAYSEVLRAALDNYARVSVANTDFPALQEIKVGQFPGDGETLGEAHVRERFGVTVVAILTDSGEAIVNPPATASIRAGDTLRVFGLPQQIADFSSYIGQRSSEQT